jgi:hypothetical protein
MFSTEAYCVWCTSIHKLYICGKQLGSDVRDFGGVLKVGPGGGGGVLGGAGGFLVEIQSPLEHAA